MCLVHLIIIQQLPQMHHIVLIILVCFLFENLKIYIENYWLTKRSNFFFNYLSPQISLKNGSVLKTNLWILGFKWNWLQPWFLFNFSKNKKLPWLGSVSFETWHYKVRFEYWTIFEGYFRAEIFEKQLWTFGQSLIFNVNL